MRSPFPGMDPYLELRWQDVHTKLIAFAADRLNQRLPDELAAEAEEMSASGMPHPSAITSRMFGSSARNGSRMPSRRNHPSRRPSQRSMRRYGLWPTLNPGLSDSSASWR